MGLSPRARAESTIVFAAASPEPCSVDITSADVCNDTIKTTLGPAGASGLFQLTVFGDYSGGPSHQLVSATRAAGTYTDNFKLGTLPEGLYDKIEASYEVAGVICHDYFDIRFKNLGTFRHSQYNTPDESDPTCGGSAVQVCFTDANCNYTTGTLKATFKAEVDENGSGKSISHGLIQPEAWCQTHGYPAPSQCAGKKVYRANTTRKPSCTGGTLSNSTVAVGDDQPDLPCGAKICLVGAGAGATNVVKTVTDRCPDCTGKKQIDNFTTDGRCSGIVDLGNFKTIRLY